ncbi:MAG: lysophospholipase [Eubacterium sp.]|nr:lysophospholipase [Eubacterium sp.]
MEKMIQSFDGTKLYMKKETDAQNRAVAVIVHGLAEHQGRYDYVAERLHEAGIGTYRFDHRGHGRSEGERTFLNDYNELLDDTNVIVDMAIAENPDLPIFVIGHSMGGFTVAGYGVKYPDKRLAGFITSGAAVAPGSTDAGNAFPEDADVHARIENSLGSGVCSVQEVVDWYGKDPYNEMSIALGLFIQMGKGMEWLSENIHKFAYPVLMLHGEKDALVNVSATFRFFEKAASEDRQMKIYGGLFHEIFNEYCKEEVVGDVISWINARI